MGGLIILAAIIIPTLLFAKIHNIYIVLMLISTVWLGAIGFIDDYIKVFKKNKEGLKGKFKIVGQVGIGLIVGAVFYFHPVSDRCHRHDEYPSHEHYGANQGIRADSGSRPGPQSHQIRCFCRSPCAGNYGRVFWPDLGVGDHSVLCFL